MLDLGNWDLTLLGAVLAFAFGYLLGSIPFGLVLARVGGLGDIRKIGSGNIGFTNVLRSGNKKIAALTLLGDVGKGVAAVLAASAISTDLGLIAGFGAFVGHCFPVWLKFKGGKGVATYVGALAASAWQGFFVFAIAWLAVVAISRYSSLGALTASLLVPFALFFFGFTHAAVVFGMMSILVWVFHRQNITRLLSGNESRIGSKG